MCGGGQAAEDATERLWAEAEVDTIKLSVVV